MPRPKPQEKVFEDKAKKILKYLKSPKRYDPQFLPRPFFLEFTGSPSAGKTFTITRLDDDLRKFGFRVSPPNEGARAIRHVERSSPLYNIRTGLYALTQLIDESVGSRHDIVIFDRCIFDVFGWMVYWEEKGKLEEWEKRMIQDFFLSRFWVDKIDLVYIMVCEPEVAIERELRVSSTNRLGQTTNPETVKKLREQYILAYQLLSPHFPQLRFLDTTPLSEQQMIDTVSMEVLNVLEAKSKHPALIT